MSHFDDAWRRIKLHEGETFHTVTGLAFTYTVPGRYVRIIRDGREINRSLSYTNFAKSAEMLPADGPGSLGDRQGASYTWAILTDARVGA